MRARWTLLLVAALAATAAPQDGNAPGGPPGVPPGPAAEAPKEPPAWKLPEKDVKKLEEALDEFLNGPARDRSDALKKIEKVVEKPVDGHSMLEDVDALVGIANRARGFNPKLKKGQIQEISVGPEVHGFPTGTVKYWLYVPKEYRDDRLWPLLFCIPDQKKHGDGKKYIEEWLSKSTNVADGFLVVVPEAQLKGAEWTSPDSLARAMISLRHAGGTFGVDRKDAGPATDYLRVFIDGEDEASVIAARFSEAFAGAVLHGADGRAGQKPNVAAAGQLSGMPAFCVIDPKSRSQREFAQRVVASNAAGVVVEDDTLAGNPAAIGLWMEKLPARRPQPREISYSVHDGSFQRHHWINVLEFDATVEPAASFDAVADRARNEVKINVDGISRFELFLSDAIVDLNRPVRVVVVDGDKELVLFAAKEGRDTLSRDLGTMLSELLDSNHPWRVYPVKLVVEVRELKEHAAAAAPPAEPPVAPGANGKPPGEAGKPQSTEAVK